jgi:hypothetical protein
MLNKKFMTKLLAGAVIAGVTLSGGIQVMASDTNDSSTPSQSSRVEKLAKVKMAVDFKGDFSAEKIKANLDKLVESKTINQEQANKILTLMEKEFEAKKAQMENFKSMTDEQKKVLFEKNREVKKTDILKDLVDQKVLSQDQANAVKKVMPQKQIGKRHGFDKGFKTQLDNLVNNGTITKDEKDKIDAYLNKKAEEEKLEMEKVKGMTEEQRQSYFKEEKLSPRVDLLEELVKEGILTQTKADALKKSLPSKGPKESQFKFNIKSNKVKTN